MTAAPVSLLVPSLALPARSDLPRSIRPVARQPLPVARLVGRRERSTVYGFTTVDARGRVADQTVMRALGWRPGDRHTIRITGAVVTVEADPDGALAVSSQGHVHLPAAVRHACAIASGDRVLLAAEASEGLLRVQSLAALDAMMAHLLATVGDAA